MKTFLMTLQFIQVFIQSPKKPLKIKDLERGLFFGLVAGGGHSLKLCQTHLEGGLTLGVNGLKSSMFIDFYTLLSRSMFYIILVSRQQYKRGL